jgi:UDP-glucose 6-dehydrogenase
MVSIDIFNKIQLKKIQNINSVFKNSDIVFILNNNKNFSQLNLNQFSNVMKKSGLIYDCWNLYDISRLNLSNDVQYISFGNHYRYKKNNN